MSKLVICEKPSVAKSIASALGVTSRADGYFEGGSWLISWCIGHLVGLADAAAYDDRYKKWRYEDLPILPAPFRYVVSEEKADQFHILRSLMERPDVTELVNACDAGREGELIFRLVYEVAGCSKPFSRLWISSMEDAAIREGFAGLRPGKDYDSLYQSALCRQKADWLVGINASRLFSVLYHRTLNIGRVQTPTLAMLADRDSKIVLFRKEKYHHVRLALEGVEAVSEKIPAMEDAQTIRGACDGQRAVCVSLAREKKTEKPPKLYDLTTLQREANRVFGYTAKQTLDYAQSLYEKKLLTYPRTDSRYLTGDMAETASVVLHLAARVTPFDACPEFFPDVLALVNDKEVSDHHAVKKSYAPQAGYSGYECELSIHLATAYISFAPVRVLRTGAFCFFQLFSEKRTQEPSPERVRSERGREDKPLTPVLYSTREGGELYGAIFFRQGKNTTSVRRISKENFGRRSEKPPPHSCETRSTRSYFFGFERKRTRAAFHNGRIRKRLFPFSSVRL